MEHILYFIFEFFISDENDPNSLSVLDPFSEVRNFETTKDLINFCDKSFFGQC